MVISNILKSQQRVVTSCLNSDEALLNNLLNIVLVLRHDARLNSLIHSLPGNAYKIDIKVKSELWLESDADSLLRLGVNYTLWSVEVEILIEHLGKSAEFLA